MHAIHVDAAKGFKGRSLLAAQRQCGAPSKCGSLRTLVSAVDSPKLPEVLLGIPDYPGKFLDGQ